MGRHSVAAPAKAPDRRLITSIIAGSVVVLLVVTGVFLWVGGIFNPLFASAGEASCGTVESITIVADTSIAPALADVGDAFDADSGGCTSTEVQAQDSADTAAVVAAGNAKADFWVPDSSVWVDRTKVTAKSLGQGSPDIDKRPSIASSPVIFATAASDAEQISTNEPLSWGRVLTGTLPALLPDPEASSASLAGLLALKGRASAQDPRQFAGAMIALGKSIPASTTAAFGTIVATEQPTVVITSEAHVATYNGDATGETLVAAYPADGTVALDYPLVRLAPAPQNDGPAVQGKSTKKPETRAEFLDALEMKIRDSDDTLIAAGFRKPDGTGTVDIAGISTEAPVTERDLDESVQIEILRSWGVLNLRSRMLAVIDVSGSMEEPADNGLRRIDIFQQAAVGAMSKFSGEVELGVWVFSTARQGDQDWEDLAPIAPLADTAHLGQIQGIIGSLPARLGGATGLYDTTFAAYKRVQESYDPNKVNTVLMITDGKNEDENGVSLDQLLAEIEKIKDPARPVGVIMIGFGPDTDVAAMQQIAQATGGGAYSATKPEDLGLVLIDALSQRGCRPNCG